MANQTWVNLGRTREHIFVVQGTLLSVRTQLNHRGCLFLEDVEPPIRVAVHLDALIVIVKKNYRDILTPLMGPFSNFLTSRSKETCRHEEAHKMADRDIATILSLFHRFYISSSVVDYNSAGFCRQGSVILTAYQLEPKVFSPVCFL
ncbi:hypothetical protein LWI28_027858 [Acer negundo]|uniref:Uncharacterized protein n=1 Tax=Acer negundo TaxID=4023 RepID=A0AAD5IGK0_ACENE|nr:hypothetical protein LWI28_027858 [Acer negundo]